jgi:hypothetical protein
VRRLVFGLGSLLLVCACANSTPTVSPPWASPWGSSVPTADPVAIASQPIVAQADGSITLLPVSPRGATTGVRYAYTTPHCGILGAIDIDGSFWDAANVPSDDGDIGGQAGTFELETANVATFHATSGAVLELIRHQGPKQFQLCE